LIATSVAPIELPRDSELAGSYGSASFADAFAVSIGHGAVDLDTAARLVLNNSPAWLRSLLALRDAMVLPLGIKTTGQLKSQLAEQPFDHIGFFRVLSRQDHELVVGERDKHLDFRASILIRADAETGFDQVVATTVVHCNNWTGRVYIRAIEPFHKMVVTSGLANLARHCA
jgi:hypothetical protein